MEQKSFDLGSQTKNFRSMIINFSGFYVPWPGQKFKISSSVWISFVISKKLPKQSSEPNWKKSFFPDNRKPKPQMRKDFTGLVLCVSNLTHAWLWLLHVLPFSNQLKNTSNNKEFLKHSLLQNKCFCRES